MFLLALERHGTTIRNFEAALVQLEGTASQKVSILVTDRLDQQSWLGLRGDMSDPRFGYVEVTDGLRVVCIPSLF